MLKFNKWKITDTLWQAGITVLIILNWSQARFASLDQLNWQESNPMLVSITDTPLKVDLYMGFCLVGNLVIASLLPGKWRRGWQIVTLLALFYCVFGAFYDGVGVDFGFFRY